MERKAKTERRRCVLEPDGGGARVTGLDSSMNEAPGGRNEDSWRCSWFSWKCYDDCRSCRGTFVAFSLGCGDLVGIQVASWIGDGEADTRRGRWVCYYKATHGGWDTSVWVGGWVPCKQGEGGLMRGLV